MGLSSSGAELELSPDSSTQSSEKQLGGPPAGWKQEANHRLAAHRARRGRLAALQTTLPGMDDAGEPAATAAHASAKGVADRVAERYAKAPTYSEILASEARNAARAAQAAAVAACDARDAAEAILIGLDVDREREADRPDGGGRPADRAFAQGPQARSQSLSSRNSQIRESTAPSRQPPAIVEAAEEEASEEDPPAPIQPLPAKLLEFPRELVAARKARPRLVEGPLREEYDRDASQSQLRIFEVEAEAISTEPPPVAAASGWSSIRLDSPAKSPADPAGLNQQFQSGTDPGRTSMAQTDLGPTRSQHLAPSRHEGGFDLPLQTASLEDRLMAAIVDAALVVAGFLLFVLVFVACTAHPPAGKPAAIGAGVALFAFSLIYQILFFSFGPDTPGMRYAKVALCTFEDENPTRKALKRRILALFLAASPLGIGLLWSFFDDDRLGWHDRISRTYQRSYR